MAALLCHDQKEVTLVYAIANHESRPCLFARKVPFGLFARPNGIAFVIHDGKISTTGEAVRAAS